jgi:hypothetical protein
MITCSNKKYIIKIYYIFMKIKLLNGYTLLITVIILFIIFFVTVYFKILFKKINVTEGMTSSIEQTGASISYPNDDEVIYTFTSSGTVSFANDTSVHLLMVAGGGAGGVDGGGGGGGGGVNEIVNANFKAGTYKITVGMGGESVNWRGDNAKRGGDSTITTAANGDVVYKVIGGGGGGNNHPENGATNDQVDGGSGGGQGSSGTGSGGPGTGPGKGKPPQGNNGAAGGYSYGGGGGGASAAGYGKDGGVGYTSVITGTPLYYGGGGGGGNWESSDIGWAQFSGGGGGNGGGANYNDSNNGQDAIYYGGGGGGSGWVPRSLNRGGNGYQGIVIMRLPKPITAQCTYASTKGPCTATVCGTSGTSTVTWTQTSPSPCLGSAPPPTTESCVVPACSPPNYTANHNVYTVVDHIPIMLQSQNRLSCISDDCKTNTGCLAISLGKNMAISFQITLNKANGTNNLQQIFGITIDPCGTDKRVFGAWLGGPSKSGIYLDTSVITDTNSTEYSVSKNIQGLTNFQATVGQNMRVDVLCNFNQQKHEIYVNGSLVETKNFAQGPYFGSGSAYIFSSFKEFQSVDGTIHDLVLLTSDYRTFRIEDLTGATTFVDTDLRGLESFQNIYSPQANGRYSSEDLRGMQTELLQEINNFNQGYSNYMKYMFNQRHNQTGDTTPKMPLYDLSGNPIADSDFAQSDFMNMYANLSESQTYNNLMNDLAVFNQAIKYNAVDMSYNMTSSDINTMLAVENELVNFRSDLDEKLAELNETENSVFMKNNRNMHAQTFKTVLLTTLATSLVYYVFIHA